MTFDERHVRLHQSTSDPNFARVTYCFASFEICELRSFPRNWRRISPKGPSAYAHRSESSQVFPPYFLARPQAQFWMKSRYVGLSMPRINVKDARRIPIAVPPLAEQHEIVRRVDALFKLADDVECRMTTARSRADKLSQAILTRAFHGELVPTEADLACAEGREYETARQLLARIREAEARTKETRKRGTTEKKGKPAMKRRKLNRESVEEAIRAMPKDRFCFDELRRELPGDYEPLREIVFSLLDDSESDLTQAFDKEAQGMLFVRRAK